MKQLVCEMCGSTELIKDGGVFVCQTCGCKYSVEEAKKMMVEGTVQVAGTVKVDNSEQIKNFLQMAENAYSAQNNNEAEDYAKKVIELDPQNYIAWDIKAKSSGWQSTGANSRIEESLSAWTNALMYVDDEHRGALVTSIVTELGNLAMAIVRLHCNNFVNYRSDENLSDITDNVERLQEQIKSMFNTAKVDQIDLGTFDNIFAGLMNKAAVSASNNNDKEFGPELSDKSKFAWDLYTSRQDLCLSLLDSAYGLADDDNMCMTICKNYVAIAEETRDSQSYKFQPGGVYEISRYVPEYSFTAGAKSGRNDSINKYRGKMNEHDPEKRKAEASKLRTTIQSSLKSRQIEAGRVKYWEEHQGEKTSLENERTELQGKISKLNSSKGQSEEKKEADRLHSTITSKNLEIQRLGIFKGKEKKALQSEIADLEDQIKPLEERAKSKDNEIDNLVRECQKRINAIDDEFMKERGMGNIEPVRTSPLVVYDENGAYNITPNALLERLSVIVKPSYRTGISGEVSIENWSEKMLDVQNQMNQFLANLTGSSFTPEQFVDNPNEAKQYGIPIYRSNGGESGVEFRIMAKSLSNILEDELWIDASGDEDANHSNLVNILTNVIFAMTLNSKYEEIQNYCIDSAYRLENTKEKVFENIKITVSTKGSLKYTISFVK